MKKIKPNTKKLSAGDLVELYQDIGPIPSGIYKLCGKGNGYFYFTISETAVFGVSIDCRKYIKKVLSTNTNNITSPADFIKRYYALLAVQSDIPFNPNKPFTYCAVDPRALRYLSEETQFTNQVH